MKSTYAAIVISVCGSLLSYQAYAATCPFNENLTCTLSRDILNDKNATNQPYYAPTNYDHRISGELNVYNSTLVGPYEDRIKAPGQIKLFLRKMATNVYQSGEIMTRANLNAPPYNSPIVSVPWTTKEISHGYLAVTVKMPTCDTSDDGLCQKHTNPESYSSGLWPAIWLLPTNDANWPVNGHINIAEAYPKESCFNISPATAHFVGTATSCIGGDCAKGGLLLGNSQTQYTLYTNYHTFGFEWQPDPNSTGAQLLTGYLDGVKVWGPTSTATFPADGPNAFSRGFNDPNGGYYLIVALAIGGPFAGPPNPHLDTAIMFIQSIKAYSVGAPPPTNNCKPPINIQSMVSPDKTQATIAWDAPTSGDTVTKYQVNNFQDVMLWQGSGPLERAFQDQTLPPSSGTYNYKIYTICTTGRSPAANYTVNTLKQGTHHE